MGNRYTSVLCESHKANITSLLEIPYVESLGGSAVWRLPLAQGVILESQDRVPHWDPCMEPASPPPSPSASVSASLSVSSLCILMNK